MLILPIVYSLEELEECQPIIKPADVPCLVISCWNYTKPCSDITARMYNSNGTYLGNYTYGPFGSSELCNYTFNITELGTYTYLVSNGDSGSIKIEENNIMSIAIIISIIALGFAFLLTSFFVDKEFKDIKAICFFSSFIFFIGAVGLGFPMLSSLPNSNSFRVILITLISIFLAIMLAIIFLYSALRFTKVFDRLSGER